MNSGFKRVLDATVEVDPRVSHVQPVVLRKLGLQTQDDANDANKIDVVNTLGLARW